MHPGEDLLDFSEPKKAKGDVKWWKNFATDGGSHLDTLQKISHQWIPPETHLPNYPWIYLFSGRVKVEIMFLDPFLGHEVDVDALKRLLFDFIFT